MNTIKLSLRDRLLEIIIWLHMIIWLFTIPIAQVQMILFGRRILTLFNFGIVEGLVLCFLFLSSKKLVIDRLSRSTLYLISIMVFILLICFIINSNVDLYWRIYFVVYWIMPLLVIVSSNQCKINLHKLLLPLLIIIVVHAVFVILQNQWNSIIWPYKYDDTGEAFFYIGEGYYNTATKMTRCPGICMSGLDAGLLLVFGIIIIMIYPRIKRWIKCCLFLLFLVAIWFTGTRNIFILVIFILGYFGISRYTQGKMQKILYIFLPVFSALIYTGIFYYLSSNYTATANILTDTSSAGIRTKVWETVWNKILEGNILQILFGFNIWQKAGTSLLIDNMYLELLMVGGFFVLFCFCGYLLFLPKKLGIIGEKHFTVLSAFISGAFLYGVANVIGNYYITLILVSIIIIKNKEQLFLEEKNESHICYK